MHELADWTALSTSLRVAGWALVGMTPLGLALGWLLARRTFPGKTLLEVLIHAPLVLPPIVTGYLLLWCLGRQSVFGQIWQSWFDQGLAFSFPAAVIAAGVMSLPLLVRSVRLAIELVDPRLEAAAATLGASPQRVFFQITLPLAGPGLLTGFTLAFARALGEFGATLVFAGNRVGETQTLPLAIYAHMQTPQGDARAAQLALVSVLLSLGAVLLSEFLAKRQRARWGMPS